MSVLIFPDLVCDRRDKNKDTRVNKIEPLQHVLGQLAYDKRGEVTVFCESFGLKEDVEVTQTARSLEQSVNSSIHYLHFLL